MSWLVPHLRRARRLLAALCCRLDIHALPAGFHRVGPDECDYARTIFDVHCRACRTLFATQTDDPHPELEARLEREMQRRRGPSPSRDRRPS